MRQFRSLAAAVPLAVLSLQGGAASLPAPPLQLTQPAGRDPVTITGSASLQQHLVREFDENWPEHRGRLLTYRFGWRGRIIEPREQLEEHLRTGFWQSAMAATLPHDVKMRQKVDAALRRDVRSLYAANRTSAMHHGAHGYVDARRVRLPVRDEKGRQRVWQYTYLALCDDCDFAMLPASRAPKGCQGTHPDQLYFNQLQRIWTGYHELMHVVAQLQALPGHTFDTEVDRDLEEGRASLAGSLALVRMFGPGMVPQIGYISDRAVTLINGHRYFNPRMYAAAQAELDGGLAGRLPQQSLRQVYGHATRIAGHHALNEDEALALSRVAARDAPDQVQERLRARDSALLDDPESEQITVGGYRFYYPPLAYRFDQLGSAGGSRADGLGWLPPVNPLRPSSFSGMAPLQTNLKNPQQVRDLNRLNAGWFGARACHVRGPS